MKYISILLDHQPGQENAAIAWLLATQPQLAQLSGSSDPQLRPLNPEYEPISIDAVRALISELGYLDFANRLRVPVLYALDKTSIPAQHALLKIIEEPPEETQIVLLTTQRARILETIRSRCLEFTVPANPTAADDSERSNGYPDLTTLIAQPLHELLAVTDLYKEREQALALVDHLLKEAHRMLEKEPRAALRGAHLLTALSQAREDLLHNGNVKLVLDIAWLRCLGKLPTQT